MGKKKCIESPEKMWELFEIYKSLNAEITMKGFRAFCKKTTGDINGYIYIYAYKEFNDIVEKIKEEIFRSKLERYKKGLISRQKICKEASLRGVDISNLRGIRIGKTNKKNQFTTEDGLLSVDNFYLK